MRDFLKRLRALEAARAPHADTCAALAALLVDQPPTHAQVDNVVRTAARNPVLRAFTRSVLDTLDVDDADRARLSAAVGGAR